MPHKNPIKMIFNTLSSYKLSKDQIDKWELHTNDIVLNYSEFKRLRFESIEKFKYLDKTFFVKDEINMGGKKWKNYKKYIYNNKDNI